MSWHTLCSYICFKKMLVIDGRDISWRPNWIMLKSLSPFPGRLQLEADRHTQNIKNRDTQVRGKKNYFYTLMQWTHSLLIVWKEFLKFDDIQLLFPWKLNAVIVNHFGQKCLLNEYNEMQWKMGDRCSPPHTTNTAGFTNSPFISLIIIRKHFSQALTQLFHRFALCHPILKWRVMTDHPSPLFSLRVFTVMSLRDRSRKNRQPVRFW